MRVDYPVTLGSKTVIISEDCETDTDVFKFLHHMHELYSNTVCEKQGKSSDNVHIEVRSDDDDNAYYEMVCYSPDVPECHFAKRKFGCHKKGGSLFPKNKTEDGDWKPWLKWNKESKREE